MSIGVKLPRDDRGKWRALLVAGHVEGLIGVRDDFANTTVRGLVLSFPSVIDIKPLVHLTTDELEQVVQADWANKHARAWAAERLASLRKEEIGQ